MGDSLTNNDGPSYDKTDHINALLYHTRAQAIKYILNKYLPRAVGPQHLPKSFELYSTCIVMLFVQTANNKLQKSLDLEWSS